MGMGEVAQKSKKGIIIILAIIAAVIFLVWILIGQGNKDSDGIERETDKVEEAGNEPIVEPTAESTAIPTVAPTVVLTAIPTIIPVTAVEVVEEPIVSPEPVTNEMQNYEFTLSGQMAEKTFYREVADTAEDDLEFYIKLGDQECVVFTLLFNVAEGDIVQMITDASGNRIPVAFTMNTPPESLSDEAKSEFYVSQDVVNEVIESIRMN